MGHEACGAVKAAGSLPIEKIQQEAPELAHTLLMLKDGLDMDRLSQVTDARAQDREAVVTNVRRQVEQLASDTCIMSKVHSNELILAGAFYEISSGIVDFFWEVNSKNAAEIEMKQAKTDAGAERIVRGNKVQDEQAMTIMKSEAK